MSKERPIPFSGPMVRAILEGRKTQTRRIMKPQPVSFEPNAAFAFPEDDQHAGKPWMPVGGVAQANWKCPYGQAGDRLWVRETWQDGEFAQNEPRGPVYRATDPDWETCEGWKWKSPRFMPRWASRITLEITGVRVERIQQISVKDILAEGAVSRSHNDDAFAMVGQNPKCPVSAFDGMCYPDLRSLWARGWNSINGPESWQQNPWVWVVEFQRVEAAK